MPQGTRKQDPRFGDWSGTRKSMTYGVLPTRAEFKRAFTEEVPDGSYDISNDSIVGTGSYSEAGLWTLVNKLTKKFNSGRRGSDKYSDLASAILSTLGFEWV